MPLSNPTGLHRAPWPSQGEPNLQPATPHDATLATTPPTQVCFGRQPLAANPCQLNEYGVHNVALETLSGLSKRIQFHAAAISTIQHAQSVLPSGSPLTPSLDSYQHQDCIIRQVSPPGRITALPLAHGMVMGYPVAGGMPILAPGGTILATKISGRNTVLHPSGGLGRGPGNAPLTGMRVSGLRDLSNQQGNVNSSSRGNTQISSYHYSHHHHPAFAAHPAPTLIHHPHSYLFLHAHPHYPSPQPWSAQHHQQQEQHHQHQHHSQGAMYNHPGQPMYYSPHPQQSVHALGQQYATPYHQQPTPPGHPSSLTTPSHLDPAQSWTPQHNHTPQPFYHSYPIHLPPSDFFPPPSIPSVPPNPHLPLNQQIPHQSQTLSQQQQQQQPQSQQEQ
ncbi:hypothetical protein PCANC_24389 [Puccinia coronata f. sp. avenae]|uniref:Uncharacterized protein n=1 Tax=Puccinia coronata f. sp. avenae TaxID=200324 RepID=A0A2N5TYK6_9BASI|nr:hypothetical protein PCANC_24389 [Puccinia coronata f. sp. avenae]